ncbi:ABC transporter permease [Lonsdalea quercina]|uniref:ABC transporter permease n=1 Tax=Lonsdalea quercina TaxID=71657 RepID=UPI003976528A
MKPKAISGVVMLVAALTMVLLAFSQWLMTGDVADRYLMLGVILFTLVAVLLGFSPSSSLCRWLLLMVPVVGAAGWLIVQGGGGAAYWLALPAVALLACLSVQRLAGVSDVALPSSLVATLFGLWVLYFWQLLVTVFAVPQVLLPTPLDIARALYEGAGMLAGDVMQTVVKSVLIGYALGCGLGVLVALLIDRLPFLQRGLLPLANLTSTIPLVGVAPIAVMWFGFDWPSKAAVIVLVTFFPALVSTLAGLQASEKRERELMYCYAASPRQTLFSLRLPAALPFIFGALKVNATLALISAIVAEFFGSPTAGLGFRISTEAARMHMATVWAAIVVASVVGSLAYALLVRLEKQINFWHPAVRGMS